jgi:hypothetical protein
MISLFSRIITIKGVIAISGFTGIQIEIEIPLPFPRRFIVRKVKIAQQTRKESDERSKDSCSGD